MLTISISDFNALKHFYNGEPAPTTFFNIKYSMDSLSQLVFNPCKAVSNLFFSIYLLRKSRHSSVRFILCFLIYFIKNNNKLIWNKYLLAQNYFIIIIVIRLKLPVDGSIKGRVNMKSMEKNSVTVPGKRHLDRIAITSILLLSVMIIACFILFRLYDEGNPLWGFMAAIVFLTGGGYVVCAQKLSPCSLMPSSIAGAAHIRRLCSCDEHHTERNTAI